MGIRARVTDVSKLPAMVHGLQLVEQRPEPNIRTISRLLRMGMAIPGAELYDDATGAPVRLGDGPGDGPEDGDDDQSPTMRGDDVEAYDRSRQEADVDVSYKETFDGVVYAPDVNGLVSQGWRMSGDGLSRVMIGPDGKRYQVVEESYMPISDGSRE